MIAGIVLAAGRSRRMGRAKAMLELGGRSFLERAITALRDGGCEPVVVVTADPAADPSDRAIVAEAERCGGRVAVNRLPGSEQIDSLRCALRALPPEARAALVLPVDVPELPAAVVGRLVDLFLRTGAPVAVLEKDGRHGHPVLFARSVWPELMSAALDGGARAVVHAHAADRAILSIPTLPADVDTPEDYRRLLEER
jgi:molybdenum cofactor cytidylyltransferase